MPKAADHQTGSGRYNGGGFFVETMTPLTGATTASGTSNKWTAPFDFVLKEAFYTITDTLTNSSARARLRKNGTAVIEVATSGLASGPVDALPSAVAGFVASGYKVRRGDVLQATVTPQASQGGYFTIVGNPI